MKKIWYESNSCWGWVENLEQLKQKAKLKIEGSSGTNHINDFLDNSKQHYDGKMNFGTRSEHRGDKTLRQFLKEQNLLPGFMQITTDLSVICPECYSKVKQDELNVFGGFCENCTEN